ncbi:hypothetical protein [Pseudomonas sp. BP8]|uniref:hypothetical protein n=1 Tax=Pseudomonas sp. BP8 TaxID=2817864 RepID=UPI001AE7A0CF|nr:hypothetical protein [Pseudomonas sp. BP8]MBP2263048.1 hypothetical protein [Pseudomonas sp. BP8]HDS1736877.1 hypothetical protein [Pseudomonas putida]
MLEFFKSQMDSGIGTAVAVIGLIALAAKSAFNIFALYDEHWSRRYYKKLKELHAAESSDGPLRKYLDDALYLEAFRIASGLSTNKITVDYLKRVAKGGRWNRHQIKQISKFLAIRSGAPTPTFVITGWQTAGARFSLLITAFFIGLGLFFGVGVAISGAVTLSGVLAGFSVEIAFIVAAAWIGIPYSDYKVARAFEAYLEKHPEILAESEEQSSNTLASAPAGQAAAPRLPTAVVQ